MTSGSLGTGPRLVDALELAAHALDELVVAGVRDTHQAISSRTHRLLDRPTGGVAAGVGLAHQAIAGLTYASIALGLRGAGIGLRAASRAGVGPHLEEGPRGRFVASAVNGLIGDRLVDERPHLAIPMALRVDGRDVVPDPAGLAAAYPDASGTVVVFVHGLSENESYWQRDRDVVGRTYADTVGDAGATPVLVRTNSGLPVRVNGVALSGLLQSLVEGWPTRVDRLVLVGHSMGGLIIRAAAAVHQDVERPWTDLVSDVITLGTPHLGAPLAGAVGRAAHRLAALPETSAVGRFLDWRSRGVHDLVEGLGEEVPALGHASYKLVTATLTASHRHPVGRWLGDLLVRHESAAGQRGAVRLFPDGEVVHLPRADHFDLLNHPDVHVALSRWLGAEAH